MCEMTTLKQLERVMIESGNLYNRICASATVGNPQTSDLSALCALESAGNSKTDTYVPKPEITV